ncbi:response regulator (plasmid) [Paracoccus liaowanqingii]|uniref:Response regulator n=1 Tax=Paracoccus liaowanqingii TaxID=2560053 RepID=A0A4Y5STK4_9RHOB|nr:response regulator [Paracoccus liaowanqingii]QDA36689.1 response regulator [Paracoccus liaowanqingii]
MMYRIMIVEDEYWTAMHLANEARDRRAIVLGPISSIEKAVKFLESAEPPDVAILDIQLRFDEVFPLADMMREARIPFIFATGYEPEDLPERFSDVPHFVKPFMGGECIEAVLDLAAAKRAAE